MKFRLNPILFSLFFGLLLSLTPTFAATLTLTKIGAMSTDGHQYSEWWYTVANPVLEGTAGASKDVTITAGGQDFSTQANTQGTWSSRLNLAKGDYDVSISSDGESYNFKLHLDQGLPTSSGTTSTTTTESTASSTVPDTGINQTTALTLGAGVSLLAIYLYFFESTKKRQIFEKKIISDK